MVTDQSITLALNDLVPSEDTPLADPVQFSTKNRLTAFLLQFFLGVFGAGYWYLGRPGRALVYMIPCMVILSCLIIFPALVFMYLMADELSNGAYTSSDPTTDTLDTIFLVLSLTYGIIVMILYTTIFLANLFGILCNKNLHDGDGLLVR